MVTSRTGVGTCPSCLSSSPTKIWYIAIDLIHRHWQCPAVWQTGLGSASHIRRLAGEPRCENHSRSQGKHECPPPSGESHGPWTSESESGVMPVGQEPFMRCRRVAVAVRGVAGSVDHAISTRHPSLLIFILGRDWIFDEEYLMPLFT